jgi:hypothetical protein
VHSLIAVQQSDHIGNLLFFLFLTKYPAPHFHQILLAKKHHIPYPESALQDAPPLPFFQKRKP